MKYTYTAVFNPEPGMDEVYNVHFPDLSGCLTFGYGIDEAVTMAQDALCLWLYHMEVTGGKIPPATRLNDIHVEGDDFTTLITTDTMFYYNFFENKLTRKTLSIPAWLDQEAYAAGVNLSQLLRRALIEELKIDEARLGRYAAKA